MKYFSLYLYVITGITIAALYIPFFVLLNQQDSSYGTIYNGVKLEGSSISEVIKTSNILITAQTCVLVGILPMILDIMMDSQVLNKLPDLWGSRCLIVIILLVPSLTFLIFRESAFMPMLYIVQFLSQNILYPTAMIHSVRKDISAVSSVVVPSLCLLALAIYGVRCVFEAYATLFNYYDRQFHVAGSNIFMTLSWVTALVASIIWLIKLWKSGNFSLISFRFQKVVPVLTFVISAVAALIVNSLFHASTWPAVTEDILVSYVFIQLVYTVFMTVLPGRVARLDAEMRMEDLTLKGIFVRFISHELRSPLNVVVSGLDFFKDEVKAISGPVRAKLEGLLQEMTVATKSAVNILTDVLDYEQLDAGMLKLDLGWFPLARLFEDKFKWAEMMASTKQITLTIEDNTVATAAGIRRLLEDFSRESSTPSMELVLRDIEEGVDESTHYMREDRIREPSRELPPFARSFLHIDASKIDQFLRNVVTNAIYHSPVGGTVIIKVDYLPVAGLAFPNPTDEVVGMLRLQVCDSGKGFAAEEQDKIAADLLRFNGRDLKGEGKVGLGLWIAQGIVKLHQGLFNLYSDGIEHGCRLVAELPLYSHPTAPISTEDEIKFSNLFSRMDQIASHENRLSDRIIFSGYTSTNIPTSNAFGDLMGVVPSELPTSPVQVFIPPSSEIDGIANNAEFSHLQDIPFLHDLSCGDREALLGDEPDMEQPHSMDGSYFHIDTHIKKVFPDTRNVPCDDLDERKRSESRVKPSSASRKINSSEEASAKVTDGLRFLIVDDSALNRKIIRRILEGEAKTFSNAVIEEADDGTSAVSAVQSALEAGLTFDFIFMDFVMVKMNGPEAVKILRNSLKFRHPIIGVTGNALPADVALFKASGADQVLLKPLNKAKFVSELLAFIGNK